MGSEREKGKFMKIEFMKIVCIPADKPYSIVIVEHDDELYCVEGYDYENDVEAWEIGSLQACCIVFDEIKQMLTESGRTVCEVGTHLSTIMQPRQMLINHTPLNVWKAIYRNLQLKDRIAKTDKILSEVRGTREVNGNDNPNLTC